MTDNTLGFDGHQAIQIWANETPSSKAMVLSPFTFLSESSTKDLSDRFGKEKTKHSSKDDIGNNKHQTWKLV